MTLQTHTRWYPYLGDAVAVRSGAVTVTGHASKSDDSVIELPRSSLDLPIGAVVDTAWRVGEQVHRGDAVVVELLPDGAVTLRLGEPPPGLSRRAHPRTCLTVPLALEPLRAGSLSAVLPSRTVDVSRGGLRAALGDRVLEVGDLVAVDVSLGERVDSAYGRVVWQDWSSFGQAVAGVRFEREMDVDDWCAPPGG